MNEHRDIYERQFNAMSEDDFNAMLTEQKARADAAAAFLRRVLYVCASALAASFAALMIVSLIYSQHNGGAGVGNYIFLIAGFLLLAIFLYDPGAEAAKRPSYEKDRFTIVEGIKRRARYNQIRMGMVIALSALLALIHLACWLAVNANLAYK